MDVLLHRSFWSFLHACNNELMEKEVRGVRRAMQHATAARGADNDATKCQHGGSSAAAQR